MSISIITPIYNAEKYLEECLQSILRQTRSDFELLLIDNNSSDRSVEICRQFMERDPRIKLYHCRKPGASAARNYGLSKATGEFVVFIDADDWVEPNHLENLIGKGLGKTDITFTNAFISYDLQLAEEEVSGPECDRDFAQLRRQTFFGWTWNKIFNREIIERHGIRFNEGMRLHEDELFTAEYCQYVTHVRVSNVKTYHYRIINTSVMRSKMPKEEKLSCYRRLYKMYSKLDRENRYLTIRVHLSHCCNMLRHCWKPDDIRLALMYVYPAYEEYRNIVRPEFLRDDRDRKVARRSPWVFRFRNGVWIWIASKIINI